MYVEADIKKLSSRFNLMNKLQKERLGDLKKKPPVCRLGMASAKLNMKKEALSVK